jgi:hypothetical protein
MTRYFIAGNIWLAIALLLFVGKRFERNEPVQFSFFGAGRWFSEGEYAALVYGTFTVSVVFFVLSAITRPKQPTTRP